MNRNSLSRRTRPAWVAVALAGLVAAAAPWLEWLRPDSLGRRATRELRVTSGADQGVGSLREAIFIADRSTARVRIVLDTPVVTVTSPLPPLINPHGVVVEGRIGGSGIDGSRIDGGPVLDVSAPNTVISRIWIAGARDQALLLRASGTRLSAVQVLRGNTGIYLTDGADDLTVDSSDFVRNVIGIRVPAAAQNVRISNNRFQQHGRAAIWSVGAAAARSGDAPGLHIHGNRFDVDETSLVLINRSARVERNTFVGAKVTAMLLDGAPSIVEANRVRSSIGFGITGDGLERAVIADNEIDHNCAGGILVRNARNTHVRANRLYANGYGIVVVLDNRASPNTVADNLVLRHFEDGLYVIGASPLIRRNVFVENRHAGLRLSALRLNERQLAEPGPLIEGNTFTRNGSDVPTTDEYRPSAAIPAPSGVTDCSWRTGSSESGTR